LAKLRPDALSGVAPDFLPLVEAYEANLGEDGFTDWAGLLTIATDAVMSEGFTHRLIGLPTILLDVPVTSGAELDLLRAFGPRIPDLLFFTPAADERTLARVQAALPMEVINLDEAKPDAASANAAAGALARLQRHLFKETSNPAKLADDDEVFISSAPGEERECVEIARRVLALARDGVLFHEIAVVLRSPEQYRATLEEVFDRAGIPPHFARGSRRPDPVGRTFYVLLSCAAGGCRRAAWPNICRLGRFRTPRPKAGRLKRFREVNAG